MGPGEVNATRCWHSGVHIRFEGERAHTRLSFLSRGAAQCALKWRSTCIVAITLENDGPYYYALVCRRTAFGASNKQDVGHAVVGGCRRL